MPGTYEWEHAGAQLVLVRLTHRPGTKVDVEVWWGPGIGRSLLLWVNLLHDAVEFADLTGNGYPGALHRIGLGTFAVNCAIQVLQATYEPGTSVRRASVQPLRRLRPRTGRCGEARRGPARLLGQVRPVGSMARRV